MGNYLDIDQESHSIKSRSSINKLEDAFENGLSEFTTYIEGLPAIQRQNLLEMLQQSVN